MGSPICWPGAAGVRRIPPLLPPNGGRWGDPTHPLRFLGPRNGQTDGRTGLIIACYDLLHRALSTLPIAVVLFKVPQRWETVRQSSR